MRTGCDAVVQLERPLVCVDGTVGSDVVAVVVEAGAGEALMVAAVVVAAVEVVAADVLVVVVVVVDADAVVGVDEVPAVVAFDCVVAAALAGEAGVLAATVAPRAAAPAAIQPDGADMASAA